MIVEKKGDISQTTADAIGHGVSKTGLLEADEATDFVASREAARQDYKEQIGSKKPGQYILTEDDGTLIFQLVVADHRYPAYHYFTDSLQAAMDYLRKQHQEGHYGTKKPVLALPKLACGPGGLRWDIVSRLIDAFAYQREGNIVVEIWTSDEPDPEG